MPGLDADRQIARVVLQQAVQASSGNSDVGRLRRRRPAGLWKNCRRGEWFACRRQPHKDTAPAFPEIPDGAYSCRVLFITDATVAARYVIAVAVRVRSEPRQSWSGLRLVHGSSVPRPSSHCGSKRRLHRPHRIDNLRPILHRKQMRFAFPTGHAPRPPFLPAPPPASPDRRVRLSPAQRTLSSKKETY